MIAVLEAASGPSQPASPQPSRLFGLQAIPSPEEIRSLMEDRPTRLQIDFATSSLPDDRDVNAVLQGLSRGFMRRPRRQDARPVPFLSDKEKDVEVALNDMRDQEDAQQETRKAQKKAAPRDVPQGTPGGGVSGTPSTEARSTSVTPQGVPSASSPVSPVPSSSSSAAAHKPSSPASSPVPSRPTLRGRVVTSPDDEEEEDGGEEEERKTAEEIDLRSPSPASSHEADDDGDSDEGSGEASDDSDVAGEASDGNASAQASDEDDSMSSADEGDAVEDEAVPPRPAAVKSARDAQLQPIRLAERTPSGKAGFKAFLADFEAFSRANRKERRASRKESGAWPTVDASQLEIDRILSNPREVSWMLDLYEGERLTPSLFEYEQMASDAGAVLPSTVEIYELYEDEPWKILSVPPEPVAFDKTSRRFARLYKETRLLYKTHAQALWERTHYFTPADDPKTDPKKKAPSVTRTRYLNERRRRNGKLTPRWNAHLQAIRELLEDGVSPDVLLDPFFYWPPAYGVLCMPVSEGESLEDCCQRLDGFEPARLYFRGGDGRDLGHHPGFKVDRDLGFTIDVPEEPSAKVVSRSSRPGTQATPSSSRPAVSPKSSTKPSKASSSSNKTTTSTSGSAKASTKQHKESSKTSSSKVTPSKASSSKSSASSKTSSPHVSKSSSKETSSSSALSGKKRPSSSETKSSSSHKTQHKSKRSRHDDKRSG
ncbi:hypothetical protein P43SY_010668 [Pythium insidiosum]|uniref:Uncharacterized protein n=1 Tax=Pythium insidiosum TaxID=114742 RepID=A0AAD5L6E0_PYTIN|nr:hypothetical protein P43SY_010668 [Pythium insidiosum]